MLPALLPDHKAMKPMSSFVSKPVHHAIASACLAIGLLAATAAYADDYADVNRLLRAGQLAEANTKADAYLATKPRDAQMRFLKGVILTEQGKPNDAITAFLKLTEEYPELPEPYNNLAVLYAGQNQFDKARAALEMAIRTNPSYATAHENLGDVYAKLASQAYSKALQLDSSNTGVQPKLGLIRDLFNPKGQRPTAAAPTAPTTIAKAPAPAVAPPAPAPAPTPAPTPAPGPAPAAVASAPVAAAPAVKPAAPLPAPPPPAPAASNSNDEQAVNAAVQAWAAAWSAKNMGDYLGAYGKDFDAPGGRKAWEEERKKRILGKNKISVKLSNVVVNVTGNTAKARFKQDYDADTLSVSSTKTLSLAKVGERWVIVRESSGG
jgi:tetratricopeptide (TPR) repeat protein